MAHREPAPEATLMRRTSVWIAFVVAAIVSMEFIGLTVFGWLAPIVAITLVVAQWRRPPGGVTWVSWKPDWRDLRAIAVFYAAIVGLYRLAFVVFTADIVAGLFFSFAAGLLLGVAGPVVYTVWRRKRPLADLGITRERLPETLVLGGLFAATQFAITLWGYDLPADAEDWVPLLVMSMTVGLFEAIFFRGFVQTRLEASTGTLPGLALAAALYGLYHVGYGMGFGDMTFLLGLGVVYAVAYRLVRNGLVLWPLLTPLGSFFANIEAGDIELPWASIMGFIDVAALMVTVIVVAHRHETGSSTKHRRQPRIEAPAPA
jgi:membrane protease YdiL (CAAX protease family)